MRKLARKFGLIADRVETAADLMVGELCRVVGIQTLEFHLVEYPEVCKNRMGPPAGRNPVQGVQGNLETKFSPSEFMGIAAGHRMLLQHRDTITHFCEISSCRQPPESSPDHGHIRPLRFHTAPRILFPFCCPPFPNLLRPLRLIADPVIEFDRENSVIPCSSDNRRSVVSLIVVIKSDRQE